MAERIEHLRHKIGSERLSLAIYIGIAAAREIYPFKRAALILPLAEDIDNLHVARAADNYGRTGVSSRTSARRTLKVV